jgi:cytochrome c biogenesis protein CcdA
MDISWYLVIINGLVDSVNPCAIGVLLLYLTLMVSWRRSWEQVMDFGIFYILSVYLTYFLIGLGMFGAVNLLGIKHIFVWAAAGVAIIFGLSSLKAYFLPRLHIPFLSPLTEACRLPKFDQRFTIAGALVLGMAVGITEFPCSGAIYLITIGLLTQKSSFVQGVLYLLVYNLMFVLPLIVIFALSGNQKIFNQIQIWQKQKQHQFKLWSGIFTIVLGLGIIWWLICN